MKNPSISILGCGWMGLPLAEHLISLGFNVKGSTTTPSKIKVLKDKKIEPFLLNCSPVLKGDGLEYFFKSEYLFLNIPFRRNLPDPVIYKRQIESVIDHLKKSSCTNIIFASSTSVYPDKIKDAAEDSEFSLDNPRSEVLLAIEQLLLRELSCVTIVRFAGLYGGDRRLGNFLAEITQLDNPQSPVNLIHLDDCIKIVGEIIQHKITNTILNACSDKHPTRKELYTLAAIKHGKKPPVFNSESVNLRHKIVSNQKLKKILNYHFIHPDPLLDI